MPEPKTPIDPEWRYVGELPSGGGYHAYRHPTGLVVMSSLERSARLEWHLSIYRRGQPIEDGELLQWVLSDFGMTGARESAAPGLRARHFYLPVPD